MPRNRHQLVVVSNRGPYRTVPVAGKRGGGRIRVRAAGGLVAALDPVLRARGGVWVSAQDADDANQPRPDVEGGEPLEYKMATVALSRTVGEAFYQGVSNAMLWPILHSLPPTVGISPTPWNHYETANRAFAEAVLEVSDPRDLVWVQDFHLMLLPAMLREARPKARIGWFCHIPWPGDDLFKILPWRRQILDGLLGADVLGFHTKSYADNFMGCLSRVGEAQVDFSRMTVRHEGRTVRVVVAPIGVPVDELQTLAADPRVTARAEKIHRQVDHRRILLGVDRLDYTKGIPQRLRAFEQVLKSDRSARNRYVMVQIMVPSRTDVQAYRELKQEIDRLIGDINGRYSSAGKVPIQYIYRNLPLDKLVAHYRAADVAVVTPLRDGMNLVAMEYCTSRIEGGGALVLSEFAGAADYLSDALLVNPYDVQTLAQTIRDALAMTADATRPAMHALRAAVHKLDVNLWAKDFLDLLEQRP
ncbi:MAG: trehalose-6-phosphate synthase [Myxococcales bacterium]|nr:trehalose-6-phosphate synthase [Myxococcales bacterium]MDD9966260.1 trehalose-6-phosphate synthase [Myxococcales bacterium]